MAINIFSETSPRISFSNEFCQADGAPIDHCKSRNSELSILESSDFDFCASSSSFEHESSSADELFSNGIILPIKFQCSSLRSNKNIISTTQTRAHRIGQKRDVLVLQLETVSTVYVVG